MGLQVVNDTLATNYIGADESLRAQATEKDRVGWGDEGTPTHTAPRLHPSGYRVVTSQHISPVRAAGIGVVKVQRPGA